MHESSYRLMSEFVTEYIKKDINYKILDVGSQIIDGQQAIGSYKSIFDKYCNVQYVGCDMVPGLNVDIVLKSPYNWQNIPANEFDFVISGQMLEHVEFPWLTFIEINRVLKPGGVCCIIAPSAGIMHNYPLDCYRYYPDGISALATYANLEVLNAFAEWERDKYPYMNETWKDCVLIARKRNNTPKNVVKGFIKRKCIHTISKACLHKTDFKSRNPVLTQEKQDVQVGKIYYDTGAGFNEKNTIRSNYKLNGKTIKLVFDISEISFKKLRFDPLDAACAISDIRIAIDGKEVKFSAKNSKTITNTDSKQNVYLFATNDPIFMIDTEMEAGSKIEISFDISMGNINMFESIIQNCK